MDDKELGELVALIEENTRLETENDSLKIRELKLSMALKATTRFMEALLREFHDRGIELDCAPDARDQSYENSALLNKE